MRFDVLSVCVVTIGLIGCHSHNQRCDCQCQCQSTCAAGCVTVPGQAPCTEKPPTPMAPMVPKEEPPKEIDRVSSPAKQAPKPKKGGTVYDSSFGKAKDFSWLAGRLRRVHVNGGSWKLRYAPLHQQDKWGGSVVLAEDARIEQFSDGEFVYVEGEIIVTRPSVYLTGPLYRITNIRQLSEEDRKKVWAARLQHTTIKK